MDQPDVVNDAHHYVVTLSMRDANERLYTGTREISFHARNLVQLWDVIKKETQLDDFTLVRYVSKEFVWRKIDPDAIHVVKKKNVESSIKFSEIDGLKNHPISLQDGDHLGVCFELQEDDYQTDADMSLRHEYEARKKQEEEEKLAEKALKRKQ